MTLRFSFSSLLLSFFLFSGALHAGAHFLELTTGDKKVTREWKNAAIRWRYNPSGAPSGAREALEAAFAAWKNESQADITIEYAGTTTDSGPSNNGFCDIFFNSDFGSLGLPSDIIALTYRNGEITDSLNSKSDRFIEDADIVLNPDLSADWITTEPTAATDLDIQEIVLHEVGHLFGLAHSFLIDSVMYPAKPRPSTDSVMRALFRVPKRSLAQDDKASIGSLYPTKAFAAETASIQGQVFYDGVAYVGAQVIAIKQSESDLSFNFYPSSTSGDLVLKGLKNVSAFSEENGKFKIDGLAPGDYRIAIQDAEGFLSFSMANVNEFLSENASASVMPTAFFQNPDCSATADILTPSNVDSNFSSSAASFSLLAGRNLCHVQINAKLGTNECLDEVKEAGSCAGGGCQVTWIESVVTNYKGVLLMVLGTLLILWSIKMQLRAKLPKLPKRDDRSTST